MQICFNGSSHSYHMCDSVSIQVTFLFAVCLFVWVYAGCAHAGVVIWNARTVNHHVAFRKPALQKLSLISLTSGTRHSLSVSPTALPSQSCHLSITSTLLVENLPINDDPLGIFQDQTRVCWHWDISATVSYKTSVCVWDILSKG